MLREEVITVGSSYWSTDVYKARAVARAATGTSAFEYTDTTRHTTPREEWKVHPDLDPKLVAGPASPVAGKNIRESRDSDDHPNSVPVAVLFDVTGSMAAIPRELQKRLPTLLELLQYREYVPDAQILFGAIGDATCDQVPLQVGQFESDNRMEDCLGKIFLESGGGGQNTESYELALYFMARHTATDSWEKRQKKGYCNTPDAPIWMADQSFSEIGKVGVGDEVMAWTHENGHRSLVTAQVVAVQRRFADNVVEVTMESGRIIRCTTDHKWLSTHHGASARDVWTNVVNRYGEMSALSHVVTPIPGLPQHLREDASWLAGVYDGEGYDNSICQYRSHNPLVCDRIEIVLDRLGFDWTYRDDSYFINGGIQARLEVLNWLPITRRDQLLQGIMSSKWGKYTHDEVRSPRMHRRPDRVVSIEPLPPQEVVSMQTTTGNYFAWGYASSNCIIIGDETAYPGVKPREVRDVIGDDLSETISLEGIVKEVQQRWELYFIVPGGHTQYGAPEFWKSLLGQNCLQAPDLGSVAETIALQIGIAEDTIKLEEGLAHLKEHGSSDSTVDAVSKALNPA